MFSRNLSTSAVRRDIDSASKFIGAGMATVGVGGSGKFFFVCMYVFVSTAQKKTIVKIKTKIVMKFNYIIGIFLFFCFLFFVLGRDQVSASVSYSAI